MPVNIISRKFWNQLRNGKTFATNVSDFTDFLQGTICEKIKAEITIDVYWKSINTPYVDIFGVGTNGSDRFITRQINSFISDGFNITDTIYYDCWFTPSGGISIHYTGTGIITIVSDLRLDITSLTGGLPDTSTGNIDSISIYGTTSLTAIIYKYNLIENSDPENYLSKIDNNTQSFTGDGLTGTDTILMPQGSFLSWQDNGNVKVKTGTSGVTGYQRFIITHEFYITPFYLPDQYNDLQNGISPSYLKDICSIKYISSFNLKKSLINPNISHGGSDSLMLGAVSWFDEHYNGLMPIEFNKQSIVYSVGGTTVTELQPNSVTHVIIEVNSVNNLFLTANTNFIVNLFKLPINEDEYQNTLTNMFENFVFEQCFQTIGSGAVSGDYGIFTNVAGTIVANRLHIEFDVTFTAAQKLLIADRQYIISVITDDHTQPHATSKEVNVLCDYNSFLSTLDNPLLLTLDSCKFWEHPFDSTVLNTGTKNFRGWITDGVYNETQFTLSAGSLLNYLKFKIRAYNSITLESFDLMLYNINLSNNPVIGGNRIVSINTTRGFKLITGSLRNLIKLDNTGIVNNYLLKFACKLRWEDWIQLLLANQDFYNYSLKNYGLSEKWSNYYDTVVNWNLEIIQTITVEDPLTLTTTDFNIISELDCHNFAEDGNTPPLWSSSLETFENSVSFGIGNNAKYSLTRDTKIVTTFTSINALKTSDIYGIIYLEKYEQGGIYGQYQLSSEELPAADNWLKPLTGETKAKVTIIGLNQVKVEGMIDYTKVNGDVSIAARIGYACQDVAEVRANRSLLVAFPAFGVWGFFDLTINGSVIVTMHAVPNPYKITELLTELGIVSGYDFTNPGSINHIICTAPIGTGSTANGDVILVTNYNALGFHISNWSFTLQGGIDAFICPGVIISTNRLLQENGSYILQENNDFINLDE